MVRFETKGDFHCFNNFAQNVLHAFSLSRLDKYGRQGVAALKSATPKKSSDTANSWSYRIEKTRTGFSVSFYNSNIQNGYSVALMLEYGHATRNGGWVAGEEYIDPAIRPIFEQMAAEAWGEVKKA